MSTTLVVVHCNAGVEGWSIFKECPNCKEYTNRFSKNASRSDGLNRVCKSCKAIDDKKYRDKYPEREKEKSKAYYKKHRDSIKRRVKQYAKDNEEAIKIKKREYFQKNKDKWNQYTKDMAAIDPVFKLKVQMRKVLLKALNGTSKSKKTEEILGCTYAELKNHIESQFESWMKWENKGLYNGTFNYGWDIDHIIPLCSAKSQEEILSLNHYTNLRPLCSHVNRNIKRDKHE
jgi:hypothetical protein